MTEAPQFVMPVDLLQEVVNYLLQCPMGEVETLVIRLRMLQQIAPSAPSNG